MHLDSSGLGTQEIKKAMTASVSVAHTKGSVTSCVCVAEDMFRSKYEELKQRTEAIKSKRSTLQTDQYEESPAASTTELHYLVHVR